MCALAHIHTHNTHIHIHTHKGEPKYVAYSCKDFDFLIGFLPIFKEHLNHSLREFTEKRHL